MRKLRTIEMQRLSVDEFHEAAKLPLIVVLDDVRSLHNVGSVFRSGDAFRVEAVYLCGITATPPHPEIHKTALGGEDSVAWRYFPTATEAIESLHNDGVFVYSIEQVEGSTKLQNLQLDTDKRYAVVLGNEVKGVHQEVVDMSDGCLEIPQFGTKHSLNVSVTAGMVIWEVAKKFLSKTF
ncbi:MULTISPECIES: RNA methyltransferase [Prevotellaceae]|uniref:RNA methyltransferase n=1 Tax=Leyella stercorea TaxID=363265 RepID=UPI001F4680BF|nr:MULTISPECIES: RNA methyltransferase [Prevotellaceae]MCF2578812.1 RNA methyltransferase [Leyella stercorea]MCI6129648.1 RNA methyltransferase [Prevotella sp.]MCI7183848.1 RNA methyltransferase [Prevotella sp.]MCI7372280.1 RNA methyltransferase [Prevotella sp.]